MGLVAVAVIASLALVSPQAAAATSQISGSAEYNQLKLVRDSGGFPRTFTKVNTGDVPFTLTNGVGVGGNDGVWLRLKKASGSGYVADSRLITAQTTYNLCNSCLNGTQFQVEYRRDDNSTFNPYWEGDMSY